jgi:hypothetical protein
MYLRHLFFIIIVAIAQIAMAEQSVNLEWDANTEPDIAGYRLHYGTTSRQYSRTQDVGKNTAASVENLVPGTRYFFAVTAYNESAMESLPSAEVSFDATAPVSTQPPALIGNFDFRTDGSVMLQISDFRSDLTALEADVEASSDLKNWTVIARLTAPFFDVNVIDAEAAGAPQRYYRLHFR